MDWTDKQTLQLLNGSVQGKKYRNVMANTTPWSSSWMSTIHHLLVIYFAQLWWTHLQDKQVTYNFFTKTARWTFYGQYTFKGIKVYRGISLQVCKYNWVIYCQHFCFNFNFYVTVTTILGTWVVFNNNHYLFINSLHVKM